MRIICDVLYKFIKLMIKVQSMLSEKEYRVCLLIRLRFPISFVGILVGLSVPGVSAIRKRMLEKLFHKRGKPKDFDDFLYGLS